MPTARKRNPVTERKTSSLRKARTASSTVKSSTSPESAPIDYTFENGLKVSGTVSQLEKIASTMGLKLNYHTIGHRPTGFYPSTSKGLIKISSMNDYHLRRALLKYAKDYFSDIFSATDSNVEFMKKFTAFPDESLVLELFAELAKR